MLDEGNVLSTAITCIEYSLPAGGLSNEDISARFPTWLINPIAKKTGIVNRYICKPEECASDLAVEAARKVFSTGIVSPADVDFILFCTQSPDYLIPTTACLIQSRLGIPSLAGALDINLGCSGFVYALGLCDGLIRSGQATTILLLTGDTYSKYVAPDDRDLVLIFGDGATATLLQSREANEPLIGPYLYGTDGNGGENLILRGSGARERHLECHAQREERLYMDGNRMFQFAVNTVPVSVDALLHKANLSADAVDLFFFHQANGYMLEEIRNRLGIARDRVPFEATHTGNTVSSTIPIAMRKALDRGLIRNGAVIMLFGFGVGLSWAGTILKWHSPGAGEVVQLAVGTA